MTRSVLVVDDEPALRETLVEFFEALGATARSAATAEEARALAAEHAPDVVLLDLRLPDADGLTLLDALRADDPDVGVIVLTGYADVRTAVGAMQRGAVDVLEKPVDLDALAAVVDRAAERGQLRREVALLRARDRTDDREASAVAPAAPTFEQLVDLAARNPDAPVLLQGETGTGKGFIARRIHDRSPRKSAPFVDINCASLTGALVESELFGHERGAFTDARQAKRGLLEVAGAGTVFLDEVAEIPLEVQPRLLKVLEERSFRRVGGTTTLRTNARLLVASNVPLSLAVDERRFRADLFFRLQVLTITLPPLRERRAELPALAAALLPRGATLAPESMAALLEYDWPGNIRELRNSLWRASILAEGSPITPAQLGLAGVGGGDGAGAAGPAALSLAEAERRAIAAALASTGGNRTHAARLLGIARSTLLEKLKRTVELRGTPQG